jgi:hypothetical protein
MPAASFHLNAPRRPSIERLPQGLKTEEASQFLEGVDHHGKIIGQGTIKFQ